MFSFDNLNLTSRPVGKLVGKISVLVIARQSSTLSRSFDHYQSWDSVGYTLIRIYQICLISVFDS